MRGVPLRTLIPIDRIVLMKENIMNLIHRIRRLAGVLAGALLASAAAAPAALASPHPLPDDGSPYLPTSPPNVVGGMPGWQIALIAVGAALPLGRSGIDPVQRSVTNH